MRSLTENYESYMSDPAYIKAYRALTLGDLETHALAVQSLRNKYPLNEQLAAEEHQAFARQFPAAAVAAPFYYLYKKGVEMGAPDVANMINERTTPASLKQLGAGLKGGYQGMEELVFGRPKPIAVGELPPIYQELSTMILKKSDLANGL